MAGTASECEDGCVSEQLLSRATSGDEQAFRELTDPLRRELQLHCYRMLGSVQDAEDMVQETMLGAWRGLGSFEQRASVRSWLYRIATNRCLNALRDARRRPAPPELSFAPPPATRMAEPTWLEPYPDVLLEGLTDTAPGPDARYEARETVELAFIAALQALPPRQRAALVLRDVLGYRTSEVAELLDSSEDSVKGALKRARVGIGERLPGGREQAPLPESAEERELVAAFADAWEASDVGRIVSLLTEDAWVTMPPSPLEYQGHEAIAAFFEAVFLTRAGRAVRLVPTRANTQPALANYLADTHGGIAHAGVMSVLTLTPGRISALTGFTDSSVFARFGLPRTLPAD